LFASRCRNPTSAEKEVGASYQKLPIGQVSNWREGPSLQTGGEAAELICCCNVRIV
jgi:hypothetical protein